jgi:hypothetical protein
MNYWQEHPIIFMNIRFMKSVLQWRFTCMGLKRLQHQNESNFRCARIESD